MQKLRVGFRSGDRVEARGQTWQVIDTERFNRLTLVSLRGVGPDNAGEVSRLLSPVDEIRAHGVATRLRTAPRGHVLRQVNDLIAQSPPWTECWTAGAARIDLRSWQLEPAAAAVCGTSRMLIADDVGLGKTVQAALILAELSARRLAGRTLILTPATLRSQWRVELQQKFSIVATVLDHGALAELAAHLPAGVNPWKLSPVTIASIDFAKRPEVRRALEEVPLDLLIVDEAHHLTPDSDRAALVSELANRSLRVVLLTATPHSGDDAAHRFLLRIGAARGDEDMQVFRRRSSDVAGGRPRRRLRFIGVRPSTREYHLLEATRSYAQRLWQGAAARPALRLVATVIARRAASSALAARLTIARRLALLDDPEAVEAQAQLPWDEADDDAAQPSDEVLATPGLESADDERACLRRLERLAAAAASDSSKIHFLRRLLHRTREPVLLFTEFRDVAIQIADSLSALVSVGLLHGGLPARIRHEAVTAFTTGAIRVLVATDAAGEGVNLHARCRLVVSLELPWSPLPLQQRIGRVDRIGQHRRVHAVALLHRDSYEGVVQSHFMARLRRSGRLGWGAAHASDMAAVARMVFDGTEHPAIAEDPAHEAVREKVPPPFAELERRLRWSSGTTGRSLDAQPLCAIGSHDGDAPQRVVLLFATTCSDRSGRWLQRELIPVTIAIEPDACAQHALSPALARTFALDRRVTGVVVAEVETRRARLAATLQGVAARCRRRAADVLENLRSAPSVPVQGSLFDRRAEQQARVSREARKMLEDHCHRCVNDFDDLLIVHASTPRLVASWLAG